MLYTNTITVLETYLSDSFISKVKSNEKVLRSFVATFHDFKQEKFELREIFEKYEKIEEKSLKAMRDVIYYGLPKDKGMFRDAIGIELPNIGEINKSVFIRHDLVHRNGKTKDEDQHAIKQENIASLCNQIEIFVKEIQEELGAIEKT